VFLLQTEEPIDFIPNDLPIFDPNFNLLAADRATVSKAMLTYLQMISHPDWPFGNGSDSLEVIRHYEAQLPDHPDCGHVDRVHPFAYVWEQIGRGWELFLVLWSEFKPPKLAYKHFLRLAITDRTKLRTTAFAGHAAATGRIKSQHYSRAFRNRYGCLEQYLRYGGRGVLFFLALG
jgi:hypothetical protein